MFGLIPFIALCMGFPIGNLQEKGLPSDTIVEPSKESNAPFILIMLLVTCIILLLVILLLYIIIKSRGSNEDELEREEENQAYLLLNSHEQELYFQSKDYLVNNPYFRGELQLSQSLLIQEKAINAYEFVKDSMLTNQDLIIINKTELNFFKEFECSSTTNLPIPMKHEVYYFECKIYSFNPDDVDKNLISIGLGIKPYPWFRLPGRHHHSISYDSNGYRRHNQPFPITCEAPFPQFIEGDVIGIGYRVRSGTVFFTRNGKKINESKIGGHIKNFKINNSGQLFPIIGANTLCSIHVNLGQAGFVFIEANVKKWGFAPLEGNGPAPPAYNKFNGDILLERSEIDDDNDLSERENDFPPDFWEVHGNEEIFDKNEINHDKFSYNAYSDVDANDERITLNSLIPTNKPPSYASDETEDLTEGILHDNIVHEGTVEQGASEYDESNENGENGENEVNAEYEVNEDYQENENIENLENEDEGEISGNVVSDSTQIGTSETHGENEQTRQDEVADETVLDPVKLQNEQSSEVLNGDNSEVNEVDNSDVVNEENSEVVNETTHP